MTSSPIPFILIGDAPTMPSGLARVGRDLARQIWDHVGLIQIGLQGPQGAMAWRGPWPLVTFSGYERMGAPTLDRVLRQHKDHKGIVFALWDAHFSWDLLDVTKRHGWEFWIYPPVDAVNQHGVFGGPAAEVIKRADRVLAYGNWAAGVLTKIRGSEVEGIPPGISDLWQPPAEKPANSKVVGCVATNQPRKDLNLYFATIAELAHRGHDVTAWLVTDALVKRQGSAWSIPELLEIHDVKHRVTVFTNDDDLRDDQLLQLYQGSSVTIAPGCGEGFGYPIVESRACGVHVIHGDYAGGPELCPLLVEPHAWRVDGPYALQRPIYKASRFADEIELVWQRVYSSTVIDPRVVTDYRWSRLMPFWDHWIRTGLDAFIEKHKS